MTKKNKKVLAILGSVLIPVAGIATAVIVINKNKDNSKSIDQIKDELQNLINEKKDSKWMTKESLQTVIDAKYGAKEITVKEIFQINGKTEEISITGNGGKGNHFKYKNSLKLEHKIALKNVTEEIEHLTDILNRHPHSAWDIDELNDALDKEYPNGGIKASYPTSLSEMVDYSEQFIFTGAGTNENEFLYSGSTDAIEHKYSQNENIKLLDDLYGEIHELIFSSEKGPHFKDSWDLNILNDLLEEKYPNGGITATEKPIKGLSSIGQNTQYIIISADGAIDNEHEYSGQLPDIGYEYSIDTTQDIITITSRLTELINSKEYRHKSWAIGETKINSNLQAVIDKEYPNGGIVVDSRTNPKDSENGNLSESFVLRGSGDVSNPKEYRGITEPITHEFNIMIVEKDIKEVQEKLINLVWNPKMQVNEVVQLDALKGWLKENLSIGGITVTSLDDEALTSNKQLEQNFRFQADGDTVLGHQYFGYLDVNYLYDVDTTINIDTEKDNLGKWINCDDKKYGLWTNEGIDAIIATKFPKYSGITYTVTSDIKDSGPSWQSFLFTGNGTMENGGLYNGTIEIVHDYIAVERISIHDDPYITEDLEYILNDQSSKAAWKVEELQVKINQAYPTGGIVVTLLTDKNNIQTFTFLGDAGESNGHTYYGVIESISYDYNSN